MCGIVGFYARESAIDYKHLDTLFMGAEKRGQDGFGYVLIRKENGKRVFKVSFKSAEPYSKVKDAVKKDLQCCGIQIGDLLIAIARAAPETEGETNADDLAETMQPIINHTHGLYIVHNGAVSNKIHRELQLNSSFTGYNFKTKIDSEAIAAAYVLKQRNMKDAMEYLSGGFAAIVYDQFKDMVYVINDFKPIAHGYVKGVGFFLHSDNDVLGEVIKSITSCERDGICMWENFYHHYLSGGRIKEIDLDSGFMRNIKYSPRFITPKWDSNRGIKVQPENKSIKAEICAIEDAKIYTCITGGDDSLCLVAASGGLDSSMTLATLKMAGYNNIIACHFNYGHRGSKAEYMAIQAICIELGIPLQYFDLSGNYRAMGTTSMLTDSNAKITTGTADGLKQLEAWVNLRNTQFLTWMATYAESLVMKFNYKKVYFLGGFLNLSESGHYPDNSEYFLQTFLDHLKYGSLIGQRIIPLYCLSNIMKHELFVMIKAFGLENVYRHTISCDRPMIETPSCDHTRINHIPKNSFDGVACNCMKDGMPACGSGLLSYWGAKMVGMDDMKLRNFCEVDDPDYHAYIPEHIKSKFNKTPDINTIINRIILPEDKLNNLRKRLNENKKLIS